MPAVLITTLISIPRALKVNRVVPGVAIPHLLGNPTLSPDEERALRRQLVLQALRALQS